MSKILRFGIKAGITVSAVDLTVSYGVWKDSETTTQLYNQIKDELRPYAKTVVDQVPFDLPRLPKAGDMCSSAKTAWNKGVMASCLFLTEIGEKAWNHTVNGIEYSYEKIREQLETPEETKTV